MFIPAARAVAEQVTPAGSMPADLFSAINDTQHRVIRLPNAWRRSFFKRGLGARDCDDPRGIGGIELRMVALEARRLPYRKTYFDFNGAATSSKVMG